MTRAYVGLGANLGDPTATLESAIVAIAALERTRLAARSPFYRSAPVDAEGPDYVNAVVALDTDCDAFALLDALQRIEAAHGRARPHRNAPRTLDLDLLLFGDAVIAAPELHVPHPRMAARAFVLAPLADIAPDAVLPGLGTARELLPAVASQRIERLH